MKFKFYILFIVLRKILFRSVVMFNFSFMYVTDCSGWYKLKYSWLAAFIINPWKLIRSRSVKCSGYKIFNPCHNAFVVCTSHRELVSCMKSTLERISQKTKHQFLYKHLKSYNKEQNNNKLNVIEITPLKCGIMTLKGSNVPASLPTYLFIHPHTQLTN